MDSVVVVAAEVTVAEVTATLVVSVLTAPEDTAPDPEVKVLIGPPGVMDERASTVVEDVRVPTEVDDVTVTVSSVLPGVLDDSASAVEDADSSGPPGVTDTRVAAGDVTSEAGTTTVAEDVRGSVSVTLSPSCWAAVVAVSTARERRRALVGWSMLGGRMTVLVVGDLIVMLCYAGCAELS